MTGPREGINQTARARRRCNQFDEIAAPDTLNHDDNSISKYPSIWFWTLLALYVIGASLLGLHGSSLSMSASYFPGAHVPLLGTPKGIRSDEWIAHTPIILNQLFRVSRLSMEGAAVGPGHAALLWNSPVKSLVELYRPQFWSFFVFSPEVAFSIYWQFKMLLLVGGVFALLHLITQSAALSAMLALFFYFSPRMQWAYSWPSTLPEMIGSACLATTLLRQMLVSGNVATILSLAIGASIFATDFALCAYPPHQVAVAWAVFAVLVWWTITRWRQIWEPPLVW